MNSLPSQERSDLSSTGRREAVTHLRGRLLVLVQIIWIALTVLALVVVVAGFSPTRILYNELCSTMVSPSIQTPVDARIPFCISYSISLSIFLFGVCFIVGLLVAWRKPNDWVALEAGLYLIFVGAFYSGFPAQLSSSSPAWWLPLHLSRFLVTLFTMLFIYLFPSGRFVPHWAGWIVITGSVAEFLSEFLPNNSAFNPDNWLWFNPSLFISLSIFGVATQIYRYRRVSDRAQKQQTKWVVFGIALSTIGILTTFLLEGLLKLDRLHCKKDTTKHLQIERYAIGEKFNIIGGAQRRTRKACTRRIPAISKSH